VRQQVSGVRDGTMSFLIVLAALGFLMAVAYRGYSVILFAPIAALGAVLLTEPRLVAPVFTGVYMDKLAGFLKLYLPVFILGAVFGKVIELSGFSQSIVASVIRLVGPHRAILSVVLVCGVLTYGGVSLFVVVFAVYPFAAELFRQGDIPKRLLPGTIALGACRGRHRSRTSSRPRSLGPASMPPPGSGPSARRSSWLRA
jgi:H+/gluconate symporter-like permease